MTNCDLTPRTRFKLAATTPIVKGLFNALRFIPEDAVIGLTRKFYGQNGYPAGQEFVEKAFRTLKHVFRTANPTCKKRIINNMIINEGIRGQQVRTRVTQQVGFDVPTLVVVSPTQRCPLKCYGCYSAEHSKTEDLTYEAFDRMVSQAKAMGIYFIVITGGEPYIYDGLFDLFAKHDDVYFQT